MRQILALGALALGLLVANAACSAADDGASSTNSAITVDNEKFVVSASPESVVLEKNVDGVSLPWGAEQLKGKALVIFPIQGITEDGVYARATDVSDDGDRLTVTTSPLSLDEMEAVTEDEVLVIKRPDGSAATSSDGSPPLVAEDGGASGADDDAGVQPPLPPGDDDDSAPSDGNSGSDDVTPQALKMDLRPLTTGSSDTSSLAVLDLSGGMSLFGSPLKATANLTHTINKVSLQPQILAESTEDSFELGFKGAFSWDSTVTLSGTLSGSGEFFHSKEFETPSATIPVPIGPTLVPVSLSLRAFVSCSASASASVSVSANIKMSANVSASMKIQEKDGLPGTDWLSAGRWPNKAGGSAKVTLSSGATAGAEISCTVPTVELHAKVGGVVGPFVGIKPTAVLGADGRGRFQTTVSAGAEAGFSKLKAKAEIDLVTLKN
jgi:hypothetical protein